MPGETKKTQKAVLQNAVQIIVYFVRRNITPRTRNRYNLLSLLTLFISSRSWMSAGVYVAVTAMVENPRKLHRSLGGPAAGITELAGKEQIL